jgi:hypothetical protein
LLSSAVRSASAVAPAALTICAAAQDAAGGGTFEFAGMQRTRYETLDPQFRAGAGFSDSDQALALQTIVTFDWRRGGLELFGEIMDSRTELNDEGSFTNFTTTNALEPIQAFVAWRHDSHTFRAGRVTQDLGKRRFVARNRYRNTVASFAGIDWTWSDANGRSLQAFYWVPMRFLPADSESVLDNEAEVDRAARATTFKGIFYQFPEMANGHRLETYLLDLESEPTEDLTLAVDHTSLGARVYRTPRPGQWNYEVEALLQRGDTGGLTSNTARRDLEHRAEFIHLEFGYAFDLPWTPNLMFQYDYASGDEDPTDTSNERLSTLFGARRFDFGPTGIYGLVARGNLDAPGVRLTLRPAQRWQTMFSYRRMRLAEARDAWVGSGWRDASGAAGRSIGRQLEGSFLWSVIPDRLSIDTGFAYWWAGRFAEQTAGAAFRGDAQYFYAAVITNF